MRLRTAFPSLVLCLALWAGASQAGLREGAAAYSRGDYAEALLELRPLAERGEALAQFTLGLMYAEGEGVARDYAEAARWYQLAALQGFPAAQYNLSNMYARGHCLLPDATWSLTWLVAAADNGYAPAQFHLGYAYAQGGVLRKDRVAAYALYVTAAANDASIDNRTAPERTALARSMSAKEKEAAERLIRELARPGNLVNALKARDASSPGGVKAPGHR